MVIDEDELLKFGYPPRFIKALSTYTIEENQPLVIEVQVDASPSAVFNWIVNGQELRESNKVKMEFAENKCRLTLLEPEEGEYRVEARNEEGMSVSIGCASYKSDLS